MKGQRVLRAVTSEERAEIERIARSRTAPVRLVERVQVIKAALEGAGPTLLVQRTRFSRATLYLWIHRFNTGGLAGLQDHPRSGRPPTYTRDEIGTVVATALTDPQSLGLPYASWTLDRLEAYLNAAKGIAIKRSRIADVLVAEGLRWRTHESWFGARVDPDFAQKRGPSRRSTPIPRREVS